jgi:hypothetical protein
MKRSKTIRIKESTPSFKVSSSKTSWHQRRPQIKKDKPKNNKEKRTAWGKNAWVFENFRETNSFDLKVQRKQIGAQKTTNSVVYLCWVLMTDHLFFSRKQKTWFTLLQRIDKTEKNISRGTFGNTRLRIQLLLPFF